MKTYVMIRVYKTQEISWFKACVKFRKLEEDNKLTDILVYDRVKEERPKGFLSHVAKQLFG